MKHHFVGGASRDSRVPREVLQFDGSSALERQRSIDGFGFFSLCRGRSGDQRDQQKGKGCIFHGGFLDGTAGRRVYRFSLFYTFSLPVYTAIPTTASTLIPASSSISSRVV